jgi:hypothetical protein
MVHGASTLGDYGGRLEHATSCYLHLDVSNSRVNPLETRHYAYQQR